MTDERLPLPSGPYIFVIERIGTKRVTQNGNDALSIEVRLMGTDFTGFWFIIDHPKARWKWNEVMDEFSIGAAEKLLGRAFIFNIRVQHWNGQPRNIFGDPLAEVLM